MRLIDADAFQQQVAAIAIMNNLPADKCNALCELIEMQPTAGSWHRVADGDLPKDHCNHNRLYWCKQKGMGYQIFRYDEEGFYYYFGIRQKIGVDNEQISAWMELPEYKEEQP